MSAFLDGTNYLVPIPINFMISITPKLSNKWEWGGIQIEQCKMARKQYYTIIGMAVADVIRPRIIAWIC